MERLADLLNHGILPFAGREAERERLVKFWHGTFEAQELRGALLVGEGGIGKTRLLDETVPSITEAGGLVIRTRIYPESESSIIALIARGLWASQPARRLLRTEPREQLQEVVAGLRRISRVRPTLLIIEDVHLAQGDALRELSGLLNAIAEERLSLLCVARPVQMNARPMLQRFLVDEIELHGLGEQALDSLWNRLFESSSDHRVVESLLRATGGNPLAIRSALRNTVRSKTLVHDPRAGRWRSTIEPELLGRVLREDVGLLTEGMVSHLTEEEKRAAEYIACLGEVFSREAAAELIDDAETLINHLIYKGIIAAAPTATRPLGEKPSEHPPLAFTHTLLHEHLVAVATVEPWRILRIIALRLPLYSIRPFQRTDLVRGIGKLPIDEALTAIQCFIGAANVLDIGPRWEQASQVWERGADLLAAIRDELPQDRRIELDTDLLTYRLSLDRRSIHTDGYRRLVERMLNLTEGRDSQPMLRYRLWGYYWLHRAEYRPDYIRCREIQNHVDEFIAHYPALRSEEAYHYYLHDVAQTAWRVPDRPTIRRVEERLKSLMDDETIAHDARKTAWRLISPQLLLLFDSAEELTERLRLMEELSLTASHNSPPLLLKSITLLADTGRLREALRMIDDAIVTFKANGAHGNTFQSSLVRLCAQAAFGGALPDLAEKARALCADAPEQLRPSFRRNSAIYLTEVGVLRDDLEWTRAIIEEFAPEAETFWASYMILRGIHEGNIEAVAATLDREPVEEHWLEVLVHRLAAEALPTPHSIDLAVRLLNTPLLRIDDILNLHGLLALLDRPIAGRTPLGSSLAEEIRTAICAALEWLAERSLFAYMPPLLERGRESIPKKVRTAWRSRVRELELRWREQESDRTDAPLRITMLDEIAVIRPDGMEPIRGARQRAMLGLLTAAEFVKHPLSPTEFRRIAAGDELDPDLARKTANMAVVRLREAIGAEAIEMGEDTHRLNRTQVRVDLLDVVEALDGASEALRDHALLRAKPAMARALELAAGKTPFPGLYDDFFEALREDLETRFRGTLLDVAAALLREGDAAGAEELLRRGFAWLPDDEEIADMLRRALTALDQRVEVERIAMRSEETADI